MTTPVFVISLVSTVIVCYLIGNINFAVIFSRLFHADIRSKGSGNPGTINMLRSVGVKAAALTMTFDILKGAAPVIGAYFIFVGCGFFPALTGGKIWMGYYLDGASKAPMYIAGLSVILGHIFPAFMKFKGGKGAASTVGVFIAASPVIGMAAFLIGVGYLFIGKYGSVTSFIVTVIMTAVEVTFALVFDDSIVTAILVICLCTLIFFAHRSNIKRLIRGEESDSNLIRRFKSIINKRRAAEVETEKSQEPSDND